ncbi:glycosyl hydrolase family 3 N terminal domain-containing protein [Myxozyma melibiosi]|uniref:beta-glucosidase n=1 Tax=Myxozyma melibiosi TaxID=54550 RepID=A0ABR1F0H1_9ASCO
MCVMQIRSLAVVKILAVVPLLLLLLHVQSACAHGSKYDSTPNIYPSLLGGRNPTDTDWNLAYIKAREFVSQLTLLEKVNLTTGTGWQMGPCVGNTGSVPRLNFSAICLQDGPLGIRFTDLNSAFPAGIATGATFNKNLMYQRGNALGLENKAKGINVALAPCIGPIGRAAEAGRNWEGFGADPYLQGIAGAETVRGIQDAGVIATAKHYLLNEQEHFRQYAEWVGFGFDDLKEPYSANADDRVLREIYVWPFAEAVRAGVGSVMCSYNQANQSQACQNSYLLNKVLKDELGFQGFVMSDWLGQRSGVASALAGMDMTMPGDGIAWADGVSLYGPNLTLAVMNGSVPTWRLDDMVTRIMAAYFKVGQDPSTYPEPNFSSWTLDTKGDYFPSIDDSPYGVVNQHVDARSSVSSQVTRQIALESVVLLKNENEVLPLADFKKLAVVGSAAGPFSGGPNGCENRDCNNGTLATGWGSGSVNFPYMITPVEVINYRAAMSGFQVDYLLEDYDHTAASTYASAADVAIVFVSSDSGEGFVDVEGNLGDRNNLKLWHGGDELIKAVAAVNSKTVVVVEAVGAVDMEEWIEHENVTAVLYSLVPGQDIGFGLADVIFGAYNPSGRLPFTIAKDKDDYPASVVYNVTSPVPQINFTEGLYVDYRHFDKQEITPRFEFGFGMSYTNFTFSNFTVTVDEEADTGEYPTAPEAYLAPVFYNGTNSSLPDKSDVEYPKNFRKFENFVYPYLTASEAKKIEYDADAYPYPDDYSETQPDEPSPAGGASGGNPALFDNLVSVTAVITNTGTLDGAEVAQVYLSYPSDAEVEFPVKALRGFEKVELQAGQSYEVTFYLTRKDLSYYEVETGEWRIPRGEFEVLVGRSSRKHQVAGSFTLE